tara:strand:+ start:2730 stop:3278 length:549 start_codon:yes stop_codon:yes gene_type:complete
MECATWDNKTLIKIADRLLKEDEVKTKKHKQERKFALKDDSRLFFNTFIEGKYGYKKNRKNSYFSEYYPNGLTFVKHQNLLDLVFDLVHGLVKPNEIKLEYNKLKEDFANHSSNDDVEELLQQSEMGETLSFYCIMGVLSQRIKEKDIDDSEMPKHLKEYIEDVISYDLHMEEKMKKRFGDK